MDDSLLEVAQARIDSSDLPLGAGVEVAAGPDCRALIRSIYEAAAVTEGSPGDRAVLELSDGATMGVDELATLVVGGLRALPADQLRMITGSRPGTVEETVSGLAPAVRDRAAALGATLTLREGARIAAIAVFAVCHWSKESFLNQIWFPFELLMYSGDEMSEKVRRYTDSQLVEEAGRMGAGMAAIGILGGSRFEYWMAAGMQLLFYHRGEETSLTEFMFPEPVATVVDEPTADPPAPVPSGAGEVEAIGPTAADIETLPPVACRRGHSVRPGAHFCHRCGESPDGSRRSREGAQNLGLVALYVALLVGVPVAVGIDAAAHLPTTDDSLVVNGPGVVDASGDQVALSLNASDPGGYQLYDVNLCRPQHSCTSNPFNFTHRGSKENRW